MTFSWGFLHVCSEDQEHALQLWSPKAQTLDHSSRLKPKPQRCRHSLPSELAVQQATSGLSALTHGPVWLSESRYCVTQSTWKSIRRKHTRTTNHTLTVYLRGGFRRGGSVMSPNDPVKRFPCCYSKISHQEKGLQLEPVFCFIDVINVLLLCVLSVVSRSELRAGAIPSVNTGRYR